MNTNNKKKVLVIVHDAGGAEIISAYIEKHMDEINFQSYVAGPAKLIFEREHIPIFNIENDRAAIANVVEKNIDAIYLISGTMGRTLMELIAVQEAKRAGLHAVAYLDSWVNYRERFLYPETGWQNNLPDELWVGDIEAQAMATKLFPSSLSIKLVPNEYFAKILSNYKDLRPKDPGRCILFVSKSCDEDALAFSWLLKAVSSMQNKPIIRLRFHPYDDRKWFRPFERALDTKIEISGEQDLASDLAQTQVVVGLETTALVVAILCGLKSICICPDGTKVTLPFLKIHRVANMTELKETIGNII